MLNFSVVFINPGGRGERAVLLLPGLVSLSVFPSWQIPVRVREPPICCCLPVCYSSWKSDLVGGNNQNKPYKTRAKLGCDACSAKAAHQAAVLPGIPGFPRSSRPLSHVQQGPSILPHLLADLPGSAQPLPEPCVGFS